MGFEVVRLFAWRGTERDWKIRPHAGTMGRLSFDDVQEFLGAAYENGQIQKKADSRALRDYGPLDEVLKTRRGK